MATKQTAINTARAFVKECKEIGITFEKVLLFGSYAKGTAREDSDIDLLLISKKFSDDVFANIKHYSKVNIRYPLVETHPYSYNRFVEGDEFLQQIAKEGINIE
jgi:predicted nucleotidyltransferase